MKMGIAALNPSYLANKPWSFPAVLLFAFESTPEGRFGGASCFRGKAGYRGRQRPRGVPGMTEWDRS